MRTRLCTALAVALMTATTLAHHGYNEYDRDVAVTLDGVVRRVLWANPHVVVTLETRTGEYAVEWASVTQLSRRGLTEVPLKVGDVIAATGSVNKNPSKRILTLLQEIRRPADGWVWRSPARERQLEETGR